MSFKEQQGIDLAIQRFIGFAHARKGYGVIDLAEGMGLEKSEWDKVRKEVSLPESDVAVLDEHFASQERDG